ncbi:insulinase family protein [Treponema parvum]|uniref:insulinase family protein n=1 Tax=Treponema parvum TaxID=138851 RepID=UPI001AEC57FD|nr:insulinase family protein [Treponema parvum]QTQ15720.1 insulinase family protein [Treponema parvum]
MKVFFKKPLKKQLKTLIALLKAAAVAFIFLFNNMNTGASANIAANADANMNAEENAARPAEEQNFIFSQKLPEGFREYTLENELKVFVLEDFSSAPVRLELAVRAGFSSQTPKTAGFFPLYTQLFSNAGKAAAGFLFDKLDERDRSNGRPDGSDEKEDSAKFTERTWYLNGINKECNADSARYIIVAAPAQTGEILKQLSYAFFSPVFSDADLMREFSALKTQVMQNAFGTAGFINSSIDSRVFASEPWKQDSGIYPALFVNTPLEEARTILTDIGRNYYTPKNSALFISGAIKAENALELAKKYFQKPAALSAGNLSDGEVHIAPSGQKKFVMHDALFTPEMSQIVIQYTGLSMHQADIAAAALNEYDSSLKKALTDIKELAIRGQDYVNAASAHKNGSSRLIFQSLLEKSKSNPAAQAETFLKTVENAFPLYASENDIRAAKEKLISQYKTRFKNSSVFMDMLSQFWAISAVTQIHTESVSQELIRQPDIIMRTQGDKIFTAYQAESPFVFVLVNSSVYKKNEKAFKKAGYEEITSKNGSWFLQKLYETLKKQLEAGDGYESESNPYAENIPPENIQIIAAEAFAAQNKKQFSYFKLSNEIPVIIKRNENAATAVISLAVSGGRLSSAKINNGLTEIMTNALARNIQKDILQASLEKRIQGEPEVLAETGLAGGIITVECLESDVLSCISCISHAIIHGNIKPAEADGLIYDRRSQHRIQRASGEYQLFSTAISLLYKNTDYPLVYTQKAEILENTQYMEILASYPSLLDASKYSLVLTGNIPKNGLEQILEEGLGVLVKQTQNVYRLYKEFPAPDFSPFITAETAGAAPAAEKTNGTAAAADNAPAGKNGATAKSAEKPAANAAPTAEKTNGTAAAADNAPAGKKSAAPTAAGRADTAASDGRKKTSSGRRIVALEHLFFTDQSAEPASPRPEILIPTAEFLDPVQFWLPSPAQSSPELITFNSLLFELEDRLSQALELQAENEGAFVKITPASAEIQAAVITFINVRHTDKIDSLYKEVVNQFLSSLQTQAVSVKNRWILQSLSKTQTNRGTALLIRSGLEQGPIKAADNGKHSAEQEDGLTAETPQEQNERKPQAPAEQKKGTQEQTSLSPKTEDDFNDTGLDSAWRYITEYEFISKLTARDMFETAQKYILDEAPLRLYSNDSKR